MPGLSSDVSLDLVMQRGRNLATSDLQTPAPEADTFVRRCQLVLLNPLDYFFLSCLDVADEDPVDLDDIIKQSCGRSHFVTLQVHWDDNLRN